MQASDSEQVLARIFVNEAVKWQHRPLWGAIVERLKEARFSGATVLRATAGFGVHSVLHEEEHFQMSGALPLVIEVVDSAQAMQRLLPILDEMLPGGLVTFETVRALRYTPGTRPKVPDDDAMPGLEFRMAAAADGEERAPALR